MCELWESLANRVYNTPAGINGLSADERTVFAVTNFESEVYNGGFWQYFFNSAGDHYRQTVVGLNVLGGANQSRELLQLAVRLGFGCQDLPADRGTRMEMMDSPRYEKWREAIDVLTDAYYDADEKLGEKLERFAKARALIK